MGETCSARQASTSIDPFVVGDMIQDPRRTHWIGEVEQIGGSIHRLARLETPALFHPTVVSTTQPVITPAALTAAVI